MPRNAVNSSSAKRKLQMEEEVGLSSQGNSSNGKRFRGNDSELLASLKRKERSWVQIFEIVDLEEVQAQTCPNDKTTGTSLPAIDDAKQSKVRRSKRFESRSPLKSPAHVRKWSDDQEIYLMNALLETRTTHGEINRAAFYQRAREQLQLEVSNSNLYAKMKSMKRRFWSMVKERKEGKLAIQTAHQQTMFVLWEKLWGTIEAEKSNPEEKETESSSPNEIEVENSKPLNDEILNLNSTKTSSSPREDTLNPDSAENLKNRENRGINTSFAGGSEFRENSALNAVNLDSTLNLDSEVNLNVAANPKHMENKAKQSLQEETHGENTNPNFTVSPKHMENNAKGSLREETQGENTHFLEESIHQETHMENARVSGPFVEKSPHQEVHVGNAREIGQAVDGSGLSQIQFRRLESRIEALIENSIKGIETRLEAANQNSASRVVTVAGSRNYQSLEEFCIEVKKGNDALSNVARTLKDLIRGVDSVEEFPSLDVGEACLLQQQWRKIKIQQLRTFSEGLELLNNQCKLFMKSVET
ncbi:hypothetical protein SUGI_0167680 [Cryptomeria japonica]|nr:hypothetical protein SUGI_0167680 [Cryptomeria japonica]